MYIEIIVTISMLGVLWNALLQTHWYIWSKAEHAKKHRLDPGINPSILDPGINILDPRRDAQGKFNPDEIQGQLDGFFEDA